MSILFPEITQAIESLVESFRTEDNVSRLLINTGLCADFADAFTNSFGCGSEIVGIEDMFEEAPSGSERMLHADPPPGTSWELLETIGMKRDLAHTWITFGGRHFDAEATEGVDNPFDLTCIRHGLHELLEIREPDLLSSLTADHEWWQATLEVRREREPLLFEETEKMSQRF